MPLKSKSILLNSNKSEYHDYLLSPSHTTPYTHTHAHMYLIVYIYTHTCHKAHRSNSQRQTRALDSDDKLPLQNRAETRFSHGPIFLSLQSLWLLYYVKPLCRVQLHSQSGFCHPRQEAAVPLHKHSEQSYFPGEIQISHKNAHISPVFLGIPRY